MFGLLFGGLRISQMFLGNFVFFKQIETQRGGRGC